MSKRGRITNAIINIQMKIFKINEFSACILCIKVIASLSSNFLIFTDNHCRTMEMLFKPLYSWFRLQLWAREYQKWQTLHWCLNLLKVLLSVLAEEWVTRCMVVLWPIFLNYPHPWVPIAKGKGERLMKMPCFLKNNKKRIQDQTKNQMSLRCLVFCEPERRLLL